MVDELMKSLRKYENQVIFFGPCFELTPSLHTKMGEAGLKMQPISEKFLKEQARYVPL